MKYFFSLSFLFFIVLNAYPQPRGILTEEPSSQQLYEKLNADGKLIVATLKKKKPDLYPLCTRGVGAVRDAVISVTTYLATSRKLEGEPWAAGNATQPYFEKLCEELADAELDKVLAEPSEDNNNTP